MSREEYRRALDAAVKEYEQALADRASLDERIAQLKQTISTLSRLCGLEPTVAWGLTDACRTLLRNAAEPLSAVELRSRLASVGFDLEKYSNSLAAIHTVLKRLEESREIAPAESDDAARVAYEFLGSGIVASRTGRPAPRTVVITPESVERRRRIADRARRKRP